MPFEMTPILVKVRPGWFARFYAKHLLKPSDKYAYEHRIDMNCPNCDGHRIRVRGLIEKETVECEEGFDGATQMTWSFLDAFCETCGHSLTKEINRLDCDQRYP